MRELLKSILEKYPAARANTPFGGQHEVRSLFEELKHELSSLNFVGNNSNLQVKYSYGKGNWAETPWIAILDKRETTTTQKGTYVVILFRADGDGCHLKLGQGVTEIQELYGSGASAIEELQRRADQVRAMFPNMADSEFDQSAQLGIEKRAKRTELYEAVTQRDAIRDLVDEYRRKNPDTEAFFSDAKNEHFFVKNLESIQGDQRDVIFISVGYGRSEDGRLTQTFGPLAAEGGERRLNVLISRAKERCTVFSSITAEDVKSAPGKLGVNAFKEFLQFAEKGYFDVPINTEKGFDSDFEESVAMFLTKHGYKVQPQVGMAGFFIDIGVIDPSNENKFYCGIECDGATYHSSRSARDRDRLRQEILESRGWKIYRIWSTDWFHRRQDQEAKLLDYLASLQNPNVIKEVNSEVVEPSVDIFEPQAVVDELRDVVVPYIESNEKYFSRNKAPHEVSVYERSKLVKKIVEIEAPIHQDEVARRVAKAFDLEKAGARIVAATVEGLRLANGLTNEAGFWSVAGTVNQVVRNRSSVVNKNLEKAEYIPPAEIAVALEHLVKSSVQIEDAELVQQVSRLFGFQRCGPDLKIVIQKVLDREVGKLLQRNGSYIYLNK